MCKSTVISVSLIRLIFPTMSSDEDGLLTVVKILRHTISQLHGSILQVLLDDGYTDWFPFDEVMEAVPDMVFEYMACNPTMNRYYQLHLT